MKALTIHPLWAWAIVHGHKPVENRSWATSHRGPLAIHASSDSPAAWESDARARAVLKGMGISVPPDADVPKSAIVGTVDLVDVVDVEVYTLMEGESLLATGPKCWVLENPVAIDPIPQTGSQGVWEWGSGEPPIDTDSHG